jgi:hypothetical protein
MPLFSRSKHSAFKPQQDDPAFSKEKFDMIRADLDIIDTDPTKFVSKKEMLFMLYELDFVADAMKGELSAMDAEGENYAASFAEHHPDAEVLEPMEIMDMIYTDMDFIETTVDPVSEIDFDATDSMMEVMFSLESMDGSDMSGLEFTGGDYFDEITIEFTVTEETEGMISLDKYSLRLFMILFAPVMAAFFAYQFIQIWKQSRRNLQMRFVKLPSDSEVNYNGEMSNVKKPISLQACIWVVSFFWFTAMMLSCGSLLQ